MKRLNYLVLIPAVMLSSCVKDKLTRDPTPQNPFINEVETAFINLEGYSPKTGQSFRADISLYENLKSFVTISDTFEKFDFATKNNRSFDVSKVSITETVAGRYRFHNVLDTDPEVVLHGLKSSDRTITGQLKLDDTNVKIRFNSELFSDKTIKDGKLPIEEEGFSRSVPVLIPVIVGGIVIAGTSIHCIYERTNARRQCYYQYDKCWAHCPGVCYFYYDSGYCGGTCEIDCQ